MKTYHQYHNESKNAESKLRQVESQRQKVEQHAGKGGTMGRKFRSIDKQANKVYMDTLYCFFKRKFRVTGFNPCQNGLLLIQ